MTDTSGIENNPIQDGRKWLSIIGFICIAKNNNEGRRFGLSGRRYSLHVNHKVQRIMNDLGLKLQIKPCRSADEP